eukprot:scaffold74707_cov48-Phaeocystis_antarctica.AAC.2
MVAPPHSGPNPDPVVAGPYGTLWWRLHTQGSSASTLRSDVVQVEDARGRAEGRVVVRVHVQAVRVRHASGA